VRDSVDWKKRLRYCGQTEVLVFAADQLHAAELNLTGQPQC
jgi:hypothetical protein